MIILRDESSGTCFEFNEPNVDISFLKPACSVNPTAIYQKHHFTDTASFSFVYSDKLKSTHNVFNYFSDWHKKTTYRSLPESNRHKKDLIVIINGSTFSLKGSYITSLRKVGPEFFDEVSQSNKQEYTLELSIDSVTVLAETETPIKHRAEQDNKIVPFERDGEYLTVAKTLEENLNASSVLVMADVNGELTHSISEGWTEERLVYALRGLITSIEHSIFIETGFEEECND